MYVPVQDPKTAGLVHGADLTSLFEVRTQRVTPAGGGRPLPPTLQHLGINPPATLGRQ
jgi:hypothetical protein